MDYAKVLNRNEMKLIMAGSMGGSCYMCCYDGGGSCSGCVERTCPCSCPDENAHIHTCSCGVPGEG